MMDRRRRQWVPLSAYYPHSHTPRLLKERFGRDGLLVWVLYLAACKRNTPQGELTFVTEPHGWALLGLDPDDLPAFTLAEFFRYTGDLHLTRKRASGDVVTITARTWDEWQTEPSREFAAARMSRKRAKDARNNGRHDSGTDLDLDLDKDHDKDQDLAADAARGPSGRTSGSRSRPRDEIWDALEAEFGRVADGTSAHGCRNKAVSDLRRLGATPESIAAAVRSWPDWFENATLTDAALAKHYPRLTNGQPPQRSNGRARGLTAEQVRQA